MTKNAENTKGVEIDNTQRLGDKDSNNQNDKLNYEIKKVAIDAPQEANVDFMQNNEKLNALYASESRPIFYIPEYGYFIPEDNVKYKIMLQSPNAVSTCIGVDCGVNFTEKNINAAPNMPHHANNPILQSKNAGIIVNDDNLANKGKDNDSTLEDKGKDGEVAEKKPFSLNSLLEYYGVNYNPYNCAGIKFQKNIKGDENAVPENPSKETSVPQPTDDSFYTKDPFTQTDVFGDQKDIADGSCNCSEIFAH